MHPWRLWVFGCFLLAPLSVSAQSLEPRSNEPRNSPRVEGEIPMLDPILGRGESAALPWPLLLQQRVPELGHRNWIVIADSAYPAQTAAGVETIATGAEQLRVVQAVLDELAKQKHVRPDIYLDAELPFVPEQHAPGIEKYRTDLKKLLGNRAVSSLPHEKIIDKLDAAGAKFKVLILKTDLKLPYTSVFLELNCGYWSDDAEKALRKAISEQQK